MNSSRNPRNRLGIAAQLALTYSVTFPFLAIGAETMEELAANVAANGELYNDIEVRTEERYELVHQRSEMPVETTLHFEVATRTVFQQEKLYYRFDRSFTNIDEQRGKDLTVRASINGYTRVIFPPNTGNEMVGRIDDHREFRVHERCLWALAGSRLSDALQGKRCGDFNTRASLSGEEIVAGSSTLKVLLEMWEDTPSDYADHPVRVILWIAPERNYIPVACEGFVPGYSEGIPLERNELDEFREISPGVWFPMRHTRTVFDETLAAKGEKVVGNRTVTRVTFVELDPHYDGDFFRLTFPDGMRVHEVKDGEITNSYIAGYPETMGWSLPRGVILSVTILAALAILFFLVRRWTSTKRATAFGK